jgi:two-component system sensor histidine kinase BarA
MNLTELSILVADDNEMNRWLLAEQLSYWSEDITIAGDGREAWQFLMQRKFALVFLDVNMPGFTGVELMLKARKDSINQLSIIIAVTAHVQSYQQHVLIADGFDDCLIKPVVLADLQRIITQSCQSNTGLESYYYASAILNKVESNRHLGRQFLKKLFEEVPTQLAALELSLVEQSVADALNIAHKLHGSFCFYGFADFRALAGKLEQALIAADTANACQQLQMLSVKFQQLLAMQTDVLKHLDD